MIIRLYVDEDSQDRDILQALRSRGADVIASMDPGMNGASDRGQLEYATTLGRVLYT